jgi:hypothetical protein
VIENKNLGSKKNILFYHLSGLSFGGTEKFLQILAKHLNRSKYNVFFMYSPKSRNPNQSSIVDGRKTYMENASLKLTPFTYNNLEPTYPYIVRNMQPSFSSIIEKEKIDIVVTAGSGYSEFPFNMLEKTPVFLLNIFGSPNMQPNVVKNICISHEVANKIRPLVPEKKIEVMYIQSEKPADMKIAGTTLRKTLGISETDVVFGRIGRAENAIFDPIGINAFENVVKEFPPAHYIIMSPPPVLVEIVKTRAISNVHFLPPSADEKDIWSFHFAIDVLAHFRRDGESFGLNIAESMLAGKPIITHKSDIWNAQLEYLDGDFSRIVDQNDVGGYSSAMRYMIEAKKNGTLAEMGNLAKKKAESLFIIENNIQRFENWLNEDSVGIL